MRTDLSVEMVNFRNESECSNSESRELLSMSRSWPHTKIDCAITSNRCCRDGDIFRLLAMLAQTPMEDLKRRDRIPAPSMFLANRNLDR